MFQALVIPDPRAPGTRHWNPAERPAPLAPLATVAPDDDAEAPDAPGNEAPPGTPGSGEAICPRCGGSGRIEADEACPECAGTGHVVRGVGGG
ncbi:hypothetical protein [Derxia gummosa]|uniref:Uncharacterized protein n=1 Tax=Derxia gummosa DSM 723 TaxID=1121388 RepID=A0A9U5GW54_9BURK|nr:hypothetical protein [Derxia gummosa]